MPLSRLTPPPPSSPVTSFLPLWDPHPGHVTYGEPHAVRPFVGLLSLSPSRREAHPRGRVCQRQARAPSPFDVSSLSPSHAEGAGARDECWERVSPFQRA